MKNTKELSYESPAAEFIMFDANDCFLRTSGNTNVSGSGSGTEGGYGPGTND